MIYRESFMKKLRPMFLWTAIIIPIMTGCETMLRGDQLTLASFLLDSARNYVITMVLLALWCRAACWWKARRGRSGQNTPQLVPEERTTADAIRQADPPREELREIMEKLRAGTDARREAENPLPGPPAEVIGMESQVSGRKVLRLSAAGLTFASAVTAFMLHTAEQITAIPPGETQLWGGLLVGALATCFTLGLILKVPARDYSPSWVILMAGMMLLNLTIMDQTGRMALETNLQDIRNAQVAAGIMAGGPGALIMTRRGISQFRQHRRKSENASQ